MRIRTEPAIYKLENTLTKEIYVGGTRDAQSRKRHHFYDLRVGRHRNPKLQRDFYENGNVFEFVVLEYLPRHISDDVIVRREQEWIEFLNPYYNSKNAVKVFGSDLDLEKERKLAQQKGRIQSQEEKNKRAESVRLYWKTHQPKKISEWHKKMISTRLSGKGHPNFGKTTSEETKNKISMSLARTEYTFLNPQGDVITVQNLKQYCKNNNMPYNSVMCIVRGTRKQWRGWKFVHKEVVK